MLINKTHLLAKIDTIRKYIPLHANNMHTGIYIIISIKKKKKTLYKCDNFYFYHLKPTLKYIRLRFFVAQWLT